MRRKEALSIEAREFFTSLSREEVHTLYIPLYLCNKKEELKAEFSRMFSEIVVLDEFGLKS